MKDRPVRDRWLADDTHARFGVLANAWKETLRDAMTDIAANLAAAKVEVRRAAIRRGSDPAERMQIDPEAYGWSVAREVYPDVLSYQVGTPANYGFAVRNGRTMADNVPEVMFSLVLNTGMTSGLTPDVTRDARAASFPYVVPAGR